MPDKHYVFPLNGTTILLSVKSPLNPRTHTQNYLASLPNAIGGNSHGTVLQTLQAEATEETRGKVTINAADIAFVQVENLSFYTSTAFVLTPAHVLSAAQQQAITDATAAWVATFDQSCKGKGDAAHKAGCAYCLYLNTHETGLTLLENTGEVASLDLMLVNTDSDTTTADSVHDNVQGVAALSAVTDEFKTSRTLAAIRKLAAWTKFRVQFNALKAEIVQALLHATVRLSPPHVPTTPEQLADFTAARAQMQIKSGNIAGHVPANFPPLPVTPISLNGDVLEAVALRTGLANYRATNDLPAQPGLRFGRHAYLKDVVELLKQLRAAEALRV